MSQWPSPSPEAIVRARVLGRARTLTRRRLAPAVAGLLLASAAAVYTHLPRHDDSHVRFVDSPIEQEVAAARVTTTTTVTVPAVVRAVTAPVRHVVTSTTLAAAPKVPVGAAPPTAPRVELSDAKGDAAAAVDIVHGTGQCPGGHIVFDVVVADLSKAGADDVFLVDFSGSGWSLNLRYDGEASATYTASSSGGQPAAVENVSGYADAAHNVVSFDVPITAVEDAARRPLDLSQPVSVSVQTRTAQFVADTTAAADAADVLRSCD